MGGGVRGLERSERGRKEQGTEKRGHDPLRANFTPKSTSNKRFYLHL